MSDRQLRKRKPLTDISNNVANINVDNKVNTMGRRLSDSDTSKIVKKQRVTTRSESVGGRPSTSGVVSNITAAGNEVIVLDDADISADDSTIETSQRQDQGLRITKPDPLEEDDNDDDLSQQSSEQSVSSEPSVTLIKHTSATSSSSSSSNSSRLSSSSSSSRPNVSAVATSKSSSSSSSSSAATAAAAAAAHAGRIVNIGTDFEAEATHRRKCVFKITKNVDPGQCLHLLDSMYDFYYSEERKYAVGPYMHIQDDINMKMRSILVDWLVEVHYKFKLQPPTLWLCVNILDRFLSKVVISRAKLQLVGVSALFIACKFEEILPPEIKDCIYITDYAYKKEELVAMEASILQEIDYQVFVPTGFHFLDRLLNSVHAAGRTRNLAFYYAERFLQEPESLDVLPHQIACAAMYCSLRQQQFQLPVSKPFADKALSLSNWTDTLKSESGIFDEEEIIPLATIMMNKVSEEPETASKRKLVAAKKKYAHEKYLGVSNLPIPRFIK